MSADAVAVRLPGTTWWDGGPVLWARLRALTGDDEVFLAEQGEGSTAAALMSELLGRCVTELGGVDVPEGRGADAVRALTAGDREALALQLRRLSFGDAIDFVVDCPACDEPMDVALDARALLAVEPPTPAAEHAAGGVRFRLPTGADLEAVAVIALDDPDAASTALLRRCLLDDVEPSEVDAQAVGAAMATLDPLAEITFELVCAACGDRWAAGFDAGGFLRREVAAGSADLGVGIHLLASQYHWREAEILSLPVARRRRYVRVVADALALV